MRCESKYIAVTHARLNSFAFHDFVVLYLGKSPLNFEKRNCFITPLRTNGKTILEHTCCSSELTLTYWTLYQGSNSFGCHPLSYHSWEQRQSVCHRLGLHYSPWPSQRNESIWGSGWLTPDALAAEMLQHKISAGGWETNTTLQVNRMPHIFKKNNCEVYRWAHARTLTRRAIKKSMWTKHLQHSF